LFRNYVDVLEMIMVVYDLEEGLCSGYFGVADGRVRWTSACTRE
jgi:hypothetical protein